MIPEHFRAVAFSRRRVTLHGPIFFLFFLFPLFVDILSLNPPQAGRALSIAFFTKNFYCMFQLSALLLSFFPSSTSSQAQTIF